MAWLRETKAIVGETIRQSLDDGLPGRGAALSYYVILSLGPLLVLLMGALELFLSGEQVRTELVAGIRRPSAPGQRMWWRPSSRGSTLLIFSRPSPS